MRYILGLMVVAMLVSPALAAYQGDFVYTANERNTVDGNYFRYSIAVAEIDMVNGFYGGVAAVGYNNSEPLAQNESTQHQGNGVVHLGRAMVAYDADTVLVLNTTPWGLDNTKMHITQVEYRGGEAYEANGQVSPGRITTYSGTYPTTEGGLLTGRLQLAVDSRGYDPSGAAGINPRVDLSGSIGGSGMYGAENVMGMAKDEDGNLYIAGRVRNTGNARVYKIPGPGVLGNSAGTRAVDLLGAPSLLVSKTTSPVSWFTGVAVGGGAVYVTDYGVGSVDVYDDTTGLPIMSVDLSIPNGVIDGVPALMPEDVRIDPSYDGLGVRLIVQVLDLANIDVENETHNGIDLLVLDVDPVTGTLLAAKALMDNGSAENGSYAYSAIDWLEVSPDGDIISADSRANNDTRYHDYSAETIALAMAAPGLIASISNGTNSMFRERTNDYGRGGAFVPEPASMALLALGGLALIRRRK